MRAVAGLLHQTSLCSSRSGPGFRLLSGFSSRKHTYVNLACLRPVHLLTRPGATLFVVCADILCSGALKCASTF